MMNPILARLGYGLAVLAGLGVVVGMAALFAVILIIPSLPSLDPLTNYQPRIPLRIYTADDVLIGEFGEERRTPVKIDAVPQKLRQAILAAEDDRFYQHGGIDYPGVLRAAWVNLTGGGEVRCAVSRDGRMAVVEVTDHGVGIAPEEMDKLFTRFGRIANQETRHIGGTGLCLYLSRQLARMQGETAGGGHA